MVGREDDERVICISEFIKQGENLSDEPVDTLNGAVIRSDFPPELLAHREVVAEPNKRLHLAKINIGIWPTLGAGLDEIRSKPLGMRVGSLSLEVEGGSFLE